MARVVRVPIDVDPLAEDLIRHPVFVKLNERISALEMELASYAQSPGEPVSGHNDEPGPYGNSEPASTYQEAPPADPWATDEPYQPEQTGQSQGNGGGGGFKVPTQGTFQDEKGKSWTFGRHGAPACDHKMPAAFVTGTKNGKQWHAWSCPLGYGDNWKSKCELFKFTR